MCFRTVTFEFFSENETGLPSAAPSNLQRFTREPKLWF